MTEEEFETFLSNESNFDNFNKIIIVTSKDKPDVAVIPYEHYIKIRYLLEQLGTE